jgi:hypothetical protein
VNNSFLVFYDFQPVGIYSFGLLLHNCNMIKQTVYLEVGSSLIQVPVGLVTYIMDEKVG